MPLCDLETAVAAVRDLSRDLVQGDSARTSAEGYERSSGCDHSDALVASNPAVGLSPWGASWPCGRCGRRRESIAERGGAFFTVGFSGGFLAIPDFRYRSSLRLRLRSKPVTCCVTPADQTTRTIHEPFFSSSGSMNGRGGGFSMLLRDDFHDQNQACHIQTRPPNLFPRHAAGGPTA